MAMLPSGREITADVARWATRGALPSSLGASFLRASLVLAALRRAPLRAIEVGAGDDFPETWGFDRRRTMVRACCRAASLAELSADGAGPPHYSGSPVGGAGVAAATSPRARAYSSSLRYRVLRSRPRRWAARVLLPASSSSTRSMNSRS